MCSSVTKHELTDLVGATQDISGGSDGTVRDACMWRVRDHAELDNYNGYMIWDTDTSVLTASEGAPYEHVTVDGHPALLGQGHFTLLLVSTGGDMTADGLLSIHLSTARPGSRDAAFTLARAALRYVRAHSRPRHRRQRMKSHPPPRCTVSCPRRTSAAATT